MNFEQLSPYGSIQAGVSLASLTTLGVGGKAAWLFRPYDEQSLVEAIKVIPEDIMMFPIGRGSNLLISDQGIHGLVMDLSDVNPLHVDGNLIVAGAGVRMSKLAQAAANAGLTGLEFMATVPGDLGGGVAMNAGAFGQQASDVLLSVQLLLRDGSVSVLNRDDLHMQYRYTQLPQGALILSASFKLANGETENIKQIMREMRAKRSQTQPLAMPNCGSVFKNPQGDFAARLIESVGLKGKQIGKANISEKHANFIVNQGGASCEDVLGLIRLAKSKVNQEAGVDLEPEVKFVGCSL